ncbi:MAG TPA: hypothetical protein VF746_26790 [Longimicrobium sp.]
MIVVDSDLMAGLCVPGLDPALARRLRAREPRWAMPRVWRARFRDVVAALVRAGRLPLDEAVKLEGIAASALHTSDVESSGKVVLRLVVESGCPAELCEFVWLARALDVPLVTTLPALLAAFPGTAVEPEAFLSGAPAAAG